MPPQVPLIAIADDVEDNKATTFCPSDPPAISSGVAVYVKFSMIVALYDKKSIVACPLSTNELLFTKLLPIKSTIPVEKSFSSLSESNAQNRPVLSVSALIIVSIKIFLPFESLKNGINESPS